jgi:hypothetical protein
MIRDSVWSVRGDRGANPQPVRMVGDQRRESESLSLMIEDLSLTLRDFIRMRLSGGK